MHDPGDPHCAESNNDRATASDREWEAEVGNAIRLAHKVMTHMISRQASLFASTETPSYLSVDEDHPQ